MEITMGAKEIVRELLDRLRDDCKIGEVIEQLYLLDSTQTADDAVAPLTDAQRRELERRLDLLDADEEPDVPWREFLGSLEHGK